MHRSNMHVVPSMDFEYPTDGPEGPDVDWQEVDINDPVTPPSSTGYDTTACRRPLIPSPERRWSGGTDVFDGEVSYHPEQSNMSSPYLDGSMVIVPSMTSCGLNIVHEHLKAEHDAYCDGSFISLGSNATLYEIPTPATSTPQLDEVLGGTAFSGLPNCPPEFLPASFPLVCEQPPPPRSDADIPRPTTPGSAARLALSISRHSERSEHSFDLVENNSHASLFSDQRKQDPPLDNLDLCSIQVQASPVEQRNAVFVTQSTGDLDDPFTWSSLRDDAHTLPVASSWSNLRDHTRARPVASPTAMDASSPCPRRKSRPTPPTRSRKPSSLRARRAACEKQSGGLEVRRLPRNKHACRFCGQMSNRPEHRDRHEKTHKPMSEKKSFHCTWEGCKTSCTRDDNLKAHVKKKHVSREHAKLERAAAIG